MSTNYKFRLFLFVRAQDATLANKRALAEVFAAESGETVANEAKALDAVRLSVSGEEPAQAFGLNTAITGTMRDGILAFLDTLTNPRWVVSANTTLPQYADGEFIMTNFPDAPDMTGKLVTWQMALSYLNNEYGLQVIVPPDETEAPVEDFATARVLTAQPQFAQTIEPEIKKQTLWEWLVALDKKVRKWSETMPWHKLYLRIRGKLCRD